MFRRALLPFGLILSLFLLFGCSDSGTDPTRPGDESGPSTAQIFGEISQDQVAFEFETAAPSSPDDPQPGRLIVRGANLSYDTELGALLVDLTLINASDRDFPEPVRLVLMELMPDTVTIQNADNEQTGPGAMFEFEFENDDSMWTTGEESLPRTVQFGIEAGVSIGFVSRVMMGDPGVTGTIGGTVWDDLNEDGIRDDQEMGMPRVHVVLHSGPEPDPEMAMMMAVTDTAGDYRFDGLPAGHYTVGLAPHQNLRPTTPHMIQVLLVEYEGEVADFLMADFGAVADTTGGGGHELEVGDCIHAKGWFEGEPDRLDMEIWEPCDADEDPDLKDGHHDCWGRIIGPITDIDFEMRAVAIMGTWVHFEDWDDDKDDDFEIGIRVRANVRLETTEEGDIVVGCRLQSFQGNWDRVRGHVQEIIENDEGGIRAVRVLNTLITRE